MKLIRTIEKNKLLPSDWGIYELSEEQSKKYGGKYALSQGIFSDFAIKEFGEEKLLRDLNEYNYEGIFQTELEAFYTVQLVAMKSKINKFQDAIDELIEVYNIDTPEWFKVIK